MTIAPTIALRIANAIDARNLLRGDIEEFEETVDITEAIIAAELAPLVEAATAALAHVTELREAWRSGALSERDGLGGLRSNRNVDVENAMRTALQQIGVNDDHN